MPSLKCHQCGKVKRCRMVQDTSVTPALIVYLCAGCAKELGHD
jgi:hypothetical protein